MARIHAERISNPARVFTEALVRVTPLDEDSAEALGLLRTWNYSMDRSQSQPLIYAKTKTYVIRFLLDHLMGDMAEEVFLGAAGGDAHARQIVVRMNQELEGGEKRFATVGMRLVRGVGFRPPVPRLRISRRSWVMICRNGSGDNSIAHTHNILFRWCFQSLPNY